MLNKQIQFLTFLNGIIMGYFVFDKLDRKGNYYIYEYDDASGEIPFYPVIYTYDNKFIASVGTERLLEYKAVLKMESFKMLSKI